MKHQNVLFTFVIFILLSTSGCKSGAKSNEITFTTSKPAPQSFDSFTFEWARPRVDPDVSLEFEVPYPNGGVFYSELIQPFPAWNPEPSTKTEFSIETTNNPIDPFFGKDILVKISVDKGSLIFTPDGYYAFNFYAGEGKNLVGTIVATMESK